MYAVVGCSDCSALWIVEGRPETTQCPRCGARRQFGKLKQFVTTDDESHARDVRASMLANRQGEGEAFAAMDSFEDMESRLDDVGVGDEEYLDAAGLNADEVAAAGSRAESGTAAGGSDRRGTVEDAIDAIDEPTAADVREYASARGVDPEYVDRALEKLVRSGRASESGGVYRLL